MFEAAELIPPVGIERQSLCLNTYPIVRYVQAGHEHCRVSRLFFTWTDGKKSSEG
jgi:hypothetical protein